MRTERGGWENGLSPETINNFRQNSPELVIRDARDILGLNDDQCETLRKILMARGINKWLKARRDIIRLKHDVKADIVKLHSNYRKWCPEDRASIKLLNSFRERLRRICHQPRWVEWPNIASAAKAEKQITVKGPTA